LSNGSPLTLIDTSVLSNFAAIGKLALLQKQWSTLYIAQAVYEEIQDGIKEGHLFLAELAGQITLLHGDGWLQVVELKETEELSLYRKLPTPLHAGEAESLVIAKQRGWRFLTDDRNARRFAARIGVKISGTLGILAQLVRQDVLQLEEANELLAQMKVQARYYTAVTDLAILIKDVREE
jgi:predicted nucleic acid-binding protein